MSGEPEPRPASAAGHVQQAEATFSATGRFFVTVPLPGSPEEAAEIVAEAAAQLAEQLGSPIEWRAAGFSEGSATVAAPPATAGASVRPVTVVAAPPDGEPEPAERKGGRPRRQNRKIDAPWRQGSLFEMPNIHENGTRNLGLTVAGAVRVEPVETTPGTVHARVNGGVVGAITLDDGQGLEELRRMLAPRCIQTMVAVTRLLWEKSNHQPNVALHTLTVGEIARAMGYKPDRKRQVDPDILRRIARDIHTLSRVTTWAADGPWDKKSKRFTTGWLAPLLVVSAIHAEYDELTRVAVPYEFDAMLGKHWAKAAKEYDMVQVPPGFLDLNEDPEILLGWYYTTGFRYRMTRSRAGVSRAITAICTEAGIDPGESKHRGRFLQRLEQWHGRLERAGIIGSFERRPGADTDRAPGELYARGVYFVTPPVPVLEAYRGARDEAARRKSGARKKPARG